MTLFDYAVLGIAGASLALGVWRGLVSEVLALVAWVVGFFVAREGAHSAGRGLSNVLPDPALQYVAGFAMMFIAVLVAIAVVRFVVRRLLSAAGLGLTDRMMGGVFGLGRAMIIVLAIVLAGGFTAFPRERWWSEATLAPPLETAVLALKPWMPQPLAQRIRYR